MFKSSLSAPIGVALALSALLAAPVRANPALIQRQLESSQRVVVTCAPQTCTAEQEAKLQETAKALQSTTGGRVFLVTAPIGFPSKGYAALGDKVRLGKKDVIVVASAKGWSMYAPGLPIAQQDELMRLAGALPSVDQGMALVAKELPAALAAHEHEPPVRWESPAPKTAPPARSSGADADDAAPTEETPAPAAAPEPEGLPLLPIAGGAVVVLALAAWLWRRRL